MAEPTVTAEQRLCAVAGCGGRPREQGHVICLRCFREVEAHCAGKRRYADWAAAQLQAFAAAAWDQDIAGYQCGFCDRWHVGGRVGRSRHVWVFAAASAFAEALGEEGRLKVARAWGNRTLLLRTRTAARRPDRQRPGTDNR